MTISSSVLPTAVERTYAHRSSVGADIAAQQAFSVAAQTTIPGIQVAGFAGETSMRVLCFTSIDGKPSQVCHSRVGLVPTVSGADNTIYDLTFEFELPPGDYFISVQGETTDWAWFGDKAGGFPSSGELSFSIADVAATADPGLRWMYAGQDAFGWGIGQIGTPGSEFNQSVAHRSVDSESAVITAYLDTQWSGGFPGIAMAKNQTQGEHFVSSLVEVDNGTPSYEFMPRTQLLELLYTGAITLPEDFHLDPHGERIFIDWPDDGRLDGVGGAAVIQNENGVEPILSPDGDAHGYTINRDTGAGGETYKIDGIGGPPGFGPGEFAAGVHRVYDFTQEIADYPGEDCCTSANARGGPMIPFLFGPDEVKAANGGPLPHVLGLTMNNTYTRPDEYWGAATHTPLRSPQHIANAPAGNAMPYGCQFRLKDSFVIDPAWPPALRTILETLKIYGMVHVDGSAPGQLVASNDRYANVSWDDPAVQMNPNDLAGIANLRFTDFDVIEPTEKKNISGCSCRRTPAEAEFTTW